MIVRNNKLIIYLKVSNNKPAAAVATPGKLAKPAAVKIPAGKSISRPGKEIWWLFLEKLKLFLKIIYDLQLSQ